MCSPFRSLITWLFAGCVLRLAASDAPFHFEDQKHQAIEDAVVSLVPLDHPAPPPSATASRVEIEQKDQEFSPLVTVVRAGTRVSLPNRDTVEHHVYSQSPAKQFEFPLYAPGRVESVDFDHAGVVALGCNIHDWMLAYVVVVDTPWFAKSDAKGDAVIHEVPPGRYRAEIWHRRLGTPLTRELTVEGSNKPQALTLTLKPDRRIRRPAATEHGEYR